MATYSINTRGESPTSSPARKPLRRRLLLIALAALLLGASAALWAPWRRPPATNAPSLTAPPVDLARFAATSDFAKLSWDQQESYVRTMDGSRDALFAAVRDGQLPVDTGRQAMQNAAPVYLGMQAKAYFALTSKQERDACLDKLIDESELWRKMRSLLPARSADSASPGAPANAPKPADAQPARNDPQRWAWGDPAALKSRIETTPPALRAQMGQFHADLRKRREERGLPPTWR